MPQGVLPPIRDILPGFLYNEPISPERSPQSNFGTLQILYTPSGSKSSSDPKDRPMISVRTARTSHSPRSISSYIPTPSFQFSGPPKMSSPTSPGSHPFHHKRSRSRSSDGSSHFSGPSDKTLYDQESEGETAAVPVPPQKRRREEKKHQCPYCKKLFHRPVSLGVHINTHTGDKPYTCPFPNCSRQFNVNSNMRRHYRTHFTPGAFDLTELSYSTADERFYPMAVNHTPPANSTNATGHHPRGRCNTGPFIPPSYGSTFSPPPTAQSYPPLRIPPNSEARPNRPTSLVVPITLYHNQRSHPNHTRDRLRSPTLASPNHRSHPHTGSTLVGRLKPASDWNLSRDRRRDEDTDEYSDDQDESHALDDDDLASPR
jgi:hypothetical protein